MAKSRTWSLACALVLALGLSAEPALAAGPKLISGQAVASAGVLQVGDAGATWELPGGGRVTAEPGTDLRWTPATKLTLSGGANKTTYVLTIKKGRVQAELPRPAADRPALLVRAPQKLGLVLEGGSATVIATGEQVAIACSSARALLNRGGPAWREVPADSIHVGSGPARQLIGAPSVKATTIVAIGVGGAARMAPVEWPAVEGAAAYLVTLSGADGEHPSRTQGTRFEPDLPLAAGRYELRVRAIDDLGLSGRPSEAIDVRVIDVALPPGAYADDEGRVHLPTSQSIALADPEGLEVSYGDPRHFAPAPSSIGLLRDETTLVFVRGKGQQRASRLTLVPRRVEASVSAGPKTAIWPRDTIELSIKLDHSDGMPADFIEIEPRVYVGLERVDVEWRDDGGTLRAQVSPRTGAGPWVVRVEAHDQYGIEIGRDFVEIDAIKPVEPHRGRARRMSRR